MRARAASKRTLRWDAVVLAFVFACMPFAVLAQCEAPYLEINNAIEQRLMPNLRGCTREEGQKFVRRLNKEATPVEGHSELEVGVVYGQSPDAGTQVTPEMDVVLNVSTGPEPTLPPPAPEPPQPSPPPAPPPPIPPPPQVTDLEVTAKPGGSGVAVGAQDTFEFGVRNSGPSDAIFTIVFQATNFLLDAAGKTACEGGGHSMSCSSRLQSGGEGGFPIVGTPEVEGVYGVSASLTVENASDTKRDNDTAVAVPRQTPVAPPSQSTAAQPTEQGTTNPPVATTAVPPPDNSSNSEPPDDQEEPNLEVTVDSVDERWVLGENLHFQINLWNRGKQDLRNVVLRIGERHNLGGYSWSDQRCVEDRCTIDVLRADDTQMIFGEFTTRDVGGARATFPVTWHAGKTEQRTEVQLVGMVGRPSWPPWVWIPICAGVLTLAWIAKVIIWPSVPPVPAVPPVPPIGASPPKQTPPIVPQVHVNPIRADITDVTPTSDIPLTAPPLRISVVLAYGEALVHGVLPVTKMEP